MLYEHEKDSLKTLGPHKIYYSKIEYVFSFSFTTTCTIRIREIKQCTNNLSAFHVINFTKNNNQCYVAFYVANVRAIS